MSWQSQETDSAVSNIVPCNRDKILQRTLLCTTKWCGVVFRGYSKATRPEGPLTNCWRQSTMPTLQQKALPTTERCWTQQEADISINEASQTTLLMWVHPSSGPRGPQSSAALLPGTVFPKPASPNCFHQTRHRALAISSNRKKRGGGMRAPLSPTKKTVDLRRTLRICLHQPLRDRRVLAAEAGELLKGAWAWQW